MIRPTLIMLTRSMREDARSGSTYGLRCCVVLVIILQVVIARATQMWFGAPGRTLFWTLAYLNVVTIVLIAIGAFAAVLTNEKESGSLPLLRLAGVGPLPTVLGNSLGVLLRSVLALIVQLPFAVLAVTLGGIAGDQVLATFGALLAFLVLCFGIGLLSSALCMTTHAAARATGWSICCLLLLPVLVEQAGRLTTELAGLAADTPLPMLLAAIERGLRDVSILDTIATVVRTGYAGGWPERMMTVHLLGGVALAIAATLVFALMPTETERAARAKSHRRRWRCPALRIRAVASRDFQFIAGGWRGIGLRIALYAIATAVVGGLLWEPGLSSEGFTSYWGMTVVLVAFTGAFFDAGMIASRVYRQEINDRTLFGLALLPASVGGWAAEKVAGCLAVLWVPFVLAVLATLIAQGAAINDGPIMLATFTFAAIGWLLATVVVVHVTLYVSLFVPSGAFPIALIGGAVLVSLLAGVLGPGLAGILLLCAVLGTPALIAIIVTRIGARLRELSTR